MKRKHFILKVLAVYLAIVMLFDVVWPTTAMALTSGPSQPEVQSFEPVGTTEMVDPFTGDFNYNIPLMTVPGPNGGYPINIAYHAGITMEQEASWVGLGWNLNVGSLNRQMRGLPDDFSGESVRKIVSNKPSVTVGLAFGGIHQGSHSDIELLGVRSLDLMNMQAINVSTLNKFALGLQIYYNNYRGVGVGFDMTLSKEKTKTSILHENPRGYGVSATFSLDPQNGAGLQANFSLERKVFDHQKKFNSGLEFSSREGLYKAGLNVSNSTKPFELEHIYDGHGTGLSFSGISYMPSNTTPTLGMNANFFYKNGVALNGFFTSASVRAFGSYSEIANSEIDFGGYGFLYSDKRIPADEQGSDKAPKLMDFNRDNDGPITKESPYLPLPVQTYDVYDATGQGTGLGFRAYRSDIGVYYDPYSSSNNFQVLAGYDIGMNYTGVNYQTGYTRTYSGKWNSDSDWDEIWTDYEFKSQNTTAEGDYEPFYFKAPGEMVATNSETGRYSGESPEAFNVRMMWAPEGGVLSFKPQVKNKRKSDMDPLLTGNRRDERDRRASYVQAQTIAQLTQSHVQPKNYVVNPLNYFPGRNTAATAITYGSDLSNYGMKNEQVGAYTTISPDGLRYEYALPVYNSKQKEVVFAVPEQAASFHTTVYNSTDASVDNDKGGDHYFSSTELPGYAYSYLLTAIYSADYVDLTGDGPTYDDLGYWVKFNYTQHTINYQWRTPFSDANYNAGNHSNALDDKASYAYGVKEIWYLNSIETKTHIAEFYLSAREDGKGVSLENQTSTSSLGESQLKLDQIKLYAKSDRNKLIKAVNFAYNYNLCKGIPNSSATGTAGKLTLEKIWFTYLENSKGKLTPYKFYYREDDPDYNPDYNVLQMDRWGYYKPDRAVLNAGNLNEDNPYVDQSNRATVDKYMSAWNLYQITLPSGGKITVDYEADDYAYVQDKRATQMFKIKHTGNSNQYGTTEEKLYDTHNSSANEVYNRIYFDLGQTVSSQNDLNEYIKDIVHMYFKTYVHLKQYQDAAGVFHEGYDYVDGFASVESISFDPAAQVTGGYTGAYITLKPVFAKEMNVNPISYAAWQYMKVERPDLLYQSMPINEDQTVLQNIGAQMSSIGVSYFRNVLSLVLGYYTSCKALNYAGDLNLNNTYHPSFIRLNSPGHTKVGGGHRVKSIRMSDNWNEMLTQENMYNPEASYNEYGMEYSYASLEGGSSGVASYEPLIGGEENPLKLPTDAYNASRDFLHNSREFYQLLPIGEAYYPGPLVGYSRVTVKNLKHEENGTELNKSTSPGISVMEFYTSRDFPVRVEHTNVDDCHYAPSINIPFVGSFEYNNNGYSQGYTVWLNDMHGKLKSVSTYASQVETGNPAMAAKYETKTDYIYQTQSPYSVQGGNKLLNLVNIMDQEGDYRFGLMGQNTDFFMDMEQNSGFTLELGGQINIDFTPPVVLPTAYPMAEYSEQMYRAIVAMKVVNQNGILKEVITRKNGSAARAQNLMFDGYTGAVVLSSLTNEHDEPVYTYSYAAHWNYDGMGSAYKNTDFVILDDITINSSDEYIVPSSYSVSEFFKIGDQLVLEYTNAFNVQTTGYFWVSDIDEGSNGIKLIDEAGVDLVSGRSVWSLRIIRSARTNQLSAGTGTVVALSNPVTDRNFPLFDALNEKLQNLNENLSSITYTDCATGEEKTATMTISANSIQFSITENCEATISLPSGLPVAMDASSIYSYRFYLAGKNVRIEFLGSNPVGVYTGTWSDPHYCFRSCLDNVLHADAVRLLDTWSYDYSDIGDPMVTMHGQAVSTTSLSDAATNKNEFRFGKKGIWRPYCNYVYQVDRKQAIPEDGQGNVTNTRRDGVYDNFVYYNWQVNSNVYNPEWTYVSQISKYSHYGFELENRDVLGHYSSAMYGYGNSVVTSVASNCSYFEQAFDGFEDYYSTTPTTGHGHVNLVYQNTTNAPSLSSANAHTGNKSLLLSSPVVQSNISTVTQDAVIKDVAAAPQTTFSFVQNRKYVATAWFKSGVSTAVPYINATNASIVSSQVMPQKIEGWQRVEIVFTPNSSSPVTITFGYTGGNGSELLDDVRIQPFTSGMVTYVYDPITLWLLAELDNRNFATFYNYDEEGGLVQTKKETEKGVSTIQSSRSNMYLDKQ